MTNAHNLKDILRKRFEQAGIFKRHEAWYANDWIYANYFGFKIPIFPIGQHKERLKVHDLHHIITGYDTSWKGELELVAWEIGNDGIGRHLLQYIHRLSHLPFCICCYPLASLRAFKRGRVAKNNFNYSSHQLYQCTMNQVRTP